MSIPVTVHVLHLALQLVQALACIAVFNLVLDHDLAAWLGLLPVKKGTPVMAGYLNRFIDLSFPELGGVDDNNRAIVWVKIRNPRLIPAADLVGAASKVRIDPATGAPVEADLAGASEATFATFAKLVLAGNVWDATWLPANLDDDTETPPLVPMPPSPDDMGKMPIDILNAIGEELKKATPR